MGLLAPKNPFADYNLSGVSTYPYQKDLSHTPYYINKGTSTLLLNSIYAPSGYGAAANEQPDKSRLGEVPTPGSG